jgi:RNA chaperone Hfq
MALDKSLDNKQINNLITNQIFSSIYFKNGIRIKGHLVGQDENCLFLKEGNMQTIYKHRVEIIEPEEKFQFFAQSKMKKA